MKRGLNWITAVSFLVNVFAAGNAFATNGYFTHGVGTKNKAMAGAGIALPEDAIDVANNPAVAPLVGNSLVIGAAFFSPTRNYETSASQINGNFGAFTIGPNSLKSKRKFFVIPHASRSWQLNNDSAWALSLYGRGGMNTTWDGGTATFDPDGPGPAGPMTFPGSFGAGNAGVDLSQAFLDITWAKKFSDQLSLGVAGVLAAQLFEARGIASFAPFTEAFAASGGMSFPQNLSDNGHDWSFGAGLKVGLHAQLGKAISVGLSYQTKIYMSEFDDYADLFAENGGFDIPPLFKFGLTVHTSESLALSFDIEHTWFGNVDSVGNAISNIFACPTAGQGGTDLSTCLGGANGAGFGWDDMTTFKFGLARSSGNDWTWRAGYSHGGQPIPSSEVTFNILAPATPEDHVTFGFTKKAANGNEWNFSLMHALKSEVNGMQTFDPTQTVKLEMYQWEAEISYGWKH